jgi:hypothetical protein
VTGKSNVASKQQSVATPQNQESFKKQEIQAYYKEVKSQPSPASKSGNKQ